MKQNKLFEELTFIKNELVQFLDKNSRNSQIEVSNLNNESYSSEGFDQKNLSKVNLKENYNIIKEDNYEHLDAILKSYNPDNKDILLFLDSDNNIWELIRRKDLNVNSLISTDELTSFNKIISDLELWKMNDNLLDVDNTSINNSDLDLSKITDNASNIVKDTINDISDLY